MAKWLDLFNIIEIAKDSVVVEYQRPAVFGPTHLAWKNQDGTLMNGPLI